MEAKVKHMRPLIYIAALAVLSVCLVAGTVQSTITRTPATPRSSS